MTFFDEKKYNLLINDDFRVDLSNFKQAKCLKNGNKYNVQFTIDASIPGLFDDLANWGFDVKTKSGKYEKRYYANDTGTYIPPTEKNFTCDVEVVETDIENFSDERLAEISITPFVAYRNSLPSMTFFDEKKYNLLINDDFCRDHNHVHAVDLGLSVKWACCNVGATKPEEYGGYYAWGETEEKSDYDWDTYKWYNGEDVTKYCVHKSCGTVDNKRVLDPADDVAHVKWGGSWRMPTVGEINELRGECNWQWTSLNGVSGYRVTGPNGNSIFLPAAGSRYGTELSSRGAYGYYWSSSLYDSSCNFACGLFFDGYYDWDYSDRYYGHSVRPVSK